jgi:hypothetical protein
LIVSGTFTVWVRLAESVTLIGTLHTPACAGVPQIDVVPGVPQTVPVESIVIPAGKPLDDHVYGGVPPVADKGTGVYGELY